MNQEGTIKVQLRLRFPRCGLGAAICIIIIMFASIVFFAQFYMHLGFVEFCVESFFGWLCNVYLSSFDSFNETFYMKTKKVGYVWLMIWQWKLAKYY